MSESAIDHADKVSIGPLYLAMLEVMAIFFSYRPVQRAAYGAGIDTVIAVTSYIFLAVSAAGLCWSISELKSADGMPGRDFTPVWFAVLIHGLFCIPGIVVLVSVN